MDISASFDLTGAGDRQVKVWSSGTIPDGQHTCHFGYDPATTPGYVVLVDAVDGRGTAYPP